MQYDIELLPDIVDKERLVGEAAKSQASTNPSQTLSDLKRRIGRRLKDSTVQNGIKLLPEDLAAIEPAQSVDEMRDEDEDEITTTNMTQDDDNLLSIGTNNGSDSTVQNDIKILPDIIDNSGKPQISGSAKDEEKAWASNYVDCLNRRLDYMSERQIGLLSKFYYNGRHMGRRKLPKVERGRNNSLRLHRWDLYWNSHRDSS